MSNGTLRDIYAVQGHLVDLYVPRKCAATSMCSNASTQTDHC
jgi:hypothetical protein